jgi:hypothetical protein
MKRKRALLLIGVLAGAVFATAAVQDGRAIGKVLRESVAALRDPLTLIADRSPGARDSGALRLTKNGPHERVLSSVRDREPVPEQDNPFAAGTPDQFAGSPLATDGNPLAGTPLAGAGSPNFARPFSAIPAVFPSSGAGSTAPSTNSPTPGGSSTPIPGGSSAPGAPLPPIAISFPSDPQPGAPSPDAPPPGSPSPPDSSPPDSPPPGSPVLPTPPTSIPEPATWTMMVLGLVAAGSSARRRYRA